MTLLKFSAETLAKDLAQQGYPNYFLITGADLLLQKEATEAVQKLVTDPQGYYACEEVEIYTDADKYNLNELLLDVNQVGLFGVRKFIKIIINRNVTAKVLSDLKELAQANDQFHVYAFILLNWERKNESSPLYKVFQQQVNCAQIPCEPLSGDAYRSWIRKRLRKYHFTFADNVINFLYERFENNMFMLQQLLEQLRLRDIKEIDIKLIEQTSQEFSDYSVFDLMPYVVAGNIRKAKAVLDYLVYQKGESLGLIIGVMRRDLIRIYSYRSHSQVSSAAEFMTSALAHQGLSPLQNQQFKKFYWDKDKRRYYETYLRTIGSRDRLYRLFIYLCDIDIANKTIFNTDTTVEHLGYFFTEFTSRNPFALRSCEIFKDKYITYSDVN
ncbi:DNA polymerase III subunit delta [Psittacicella melopsittaci]|uniref:DNA polymerase III subunit delta n=1 Tax=Psittacicella melopsittaci TaxID=2028576 RepID=A0A3A1Y9T1_9GAMM|nr:DNA polymerase III subunit delta [Psittacicella melopsittaci]RIY33948.1 DNA polymerase III subunit delta [Psittacicella melopsittaci]